MKQVRNAVNTSLKLDRDTYKNFRAVCLCKGITTSEQLEQLMREYTKKYAKEASEHLKNVAKRVENA